MQTQISIQEQGLAGGVRMQSPAQLVAAQFRAHPQICQFKDQGLSYDFSRSGSNPYQLTLDHIEVVESNWGNGIGSSALKILTDLADRHGVKLDLELGHDKRGIGLVNWYGRHGFAWNDGGFMERANPGTHGFHVTSASALASIEAQGLIPQIGPRSRLMDEAQPATYFFASKEDVENALMNWLGEEFDDDETILVLEVNLRGIEIKREIGQFEFTTHQTIEADRILNVYDENLRRRNASRVKP